MRYIAGISGARGWVLIEIAALQANFKSAATASGRINYVDVGHGRTAVFVHGLITNSLLWRHVISDVAHDQRRCVAADLPGHGRTPLQTSTPMSH
ncbi:alpha/beta fold hydrolase [Mycobacterium kubicae]|uniref:Alpha/beta fold hydrolase n=1 Tax=Mycobacterium kubicae TaxID=120959 RepID=A0AAX1JCA5_9MYCO|nr:alpha/beta fold hydrolase [Mycobacterium kubicae]QNI09857.1 alpha/beta fold hydrolase [Mycobacterium kubicae]QPI38055.1 alpha/beta fold hydrolase [Mycobacterium kubicae]